MADALSGVPGPAGGPTVIGIGTDLVEVEAPLDDSVDASRATAMEGVGMVSGDVAVPDAHPLVLWRLPEELTS